LTSSRHWDDATGDVEAMVRSAGHYVRASDDLRPRVLEMASVQRGEEWAQCCIRRVALVVVLLATFSTVGRHPLLSNGTASRNTLFSVELEQSLTRAAMSNVATGNSSWNAVEALTNLRERQAEALRLAF
jgi:hypothetical protein